MLQIARKTYNGVEIGYVVGNWVHARRGWHLRPKLTFRSIREGVLFKTQDEAREYRDDLENRRVKSSVKFEGCD